MNSNTALLSISSFYWLGFWETKCPGAWDTWLQQLNNEQNLMYWSALKILFKRVQSQWNLLLLNFKLIFKFSCLIFYSHKNSQTLKLTHGHIHPYLHTCIPTHIHIHSYTTLICMCTHTRTPLTCKNIDTHTLTYRHTLPYSGNVNLQKPQQFCKNRNGDIIWNFEF